jgi:hypothetical protein
MRLGPGKVRPSRLGVPAPPSWQRGRASSLSRPRPR